MTSLVDTSVLIDVLRGNPTARDLLLAERTCGPLLASEITRLEVLAGMRAAERERTLRLLSALAWQPVDTAVAEKAGELGRDWLPGHGGIDSADLAIAATAVLQEATLLTRNVKHFPMFTGLRAPY